MCVLIIWWYHQCWWQEARGTLKAHIIGQTGFKSRDKAIGFHKRKATRWRWQWWGEYYWIIFYKILRLQELVLFLFWLCFWTTFISYKRYHYQSRELTKSFCFESGWGHVNPSDGGIGNGDLCLHCRPNCHHYNSQGQLRTPDILASSKLFLKRECKFFVAEWNNTN